MAFYVATSDILGGFAMAPAEELLTTLGQGGAFIVRIRSTFEFHTSYSLARIFSIFLSQIPLAVDDSQVEKSHFVVCKALNQICPRGGCLQATIENNLSVPEKPPKWRMHG